MVEKSINEELIKRIKELEKEVGNRLLLKEQNKHLNILREDLLKSASLNEKLKIITDGIIEIFDADFCRIWIIRPGDLCDSGCIHAEITEGPHACKHRTRCLHLMVSSGRYTHIDGETHRRVPFGCYKIGRIASEEDHKLITNDVTNDPRVHNREWARDLGLVSFSGYRVLSEDAGPIGVLALFSKHEISPDEDALLEGLAETIARLIHTTKTKEALKESEERFRLIFERSNDVIIVYQVGKIKDVNLKACEVTGI
jgi:GAF domain-containing protein